MRLQPKRVGPEKGGKVPTLTQQSAEYAEEGPVEEEREIMVSLEPSPPLGADYTPPSHAEEDTPMTTTLPAVRIDQQIHVIRGHRVMLDADLADVYHVSTKRFNERATRNINRFPPDFMFQLSFREFRDLRSQSATSSLH